MKSTPIAIAASTSAITCTTVEPETASAFRKSPELKSGPKNPRTVSAEAFKNRRAKARHGRQSKRFNPRAMRGSRRTRRGSMNVTKNSGSISAIRIRPPIAATTRMSWRLRARLAAAAAEDGLAARADVDDLAARELELLGLILRQLREQVLAVVADELDPHLEAEMDDPLDHRLGRAGVRLEPELDVVWANEGVP